MTKILWRATDIRYDCKNCCFCGEKCGMMCERMAKKMEVPFAYAILIKEPKEEYQGG